MLRCTLSALVGARCDLFGIMPLDTQSPVAELSVVSPSPATASPSARWSDDLAIPADTDLWVFGYGSLMWNPGFPYLESRAACLNGYHRRFCVSSHRYRGTPDRPGLVLGLDRGGSCRGIAFRVAPEHVPATMDYLWEREMINRVYHPKLLPVQCADVEGDKGCAGRRATVTACTFVVDRRHGQYCGCLDEATMAERIAGCRGERGPNFDYLANTVAHLEKLGIHDRGLSSLLAAVRARIG